MNGTMRYHCAHAAEVRDFISQIVPLAARERLFKVAAKFSISSYRGYIHGLLRA